MLKLLETQLILGYKNVAIAMEWNVTWFGNSYKRSNSKIKRDINVLFVQVLSPFWNTWVDLLFSYEYWLFLYSYIFMWDSCTISLGYKMFPFIYSFAKIKEDSMGNKTGNGAVICTMVFQDTLHSNDIITYVVWWHFITTMLMIEFEDSPWVFWAVLTCIIGSS